MNPNARDTDKDGDVRPVFTAPKPLSMSILSVINELICSEMQLRFYYHSGDMIPMSDLYRLLTKCTTTPDLMVRKLIEMNVIGVTDNANVVVLK
ncbi:hypothetical protein [Deltalipothrixvirus pozzuoliense]|uniref:Uncharacterized protein ORF93 n=1 Tax=Acidianus filamentous virus 2 (isolate Italy/Pozzuoli) TaxID=654910 RepID=Y093_AFV2P|nr:hypothetical protein AFV2_gp40 [Acidianus filamentous virus 2]Q573C9.1 RecName: Full=Uncharacterized protein ORF93 [Acidianus filamentous virus 2 (isolate Pozzuoli)]CAH69427.1 hypothetical protein [Acidianus filamentous virus 2]